MPVERVNDESTNHIETIFVGAIGLALHTQADSILTTTLTVSPGNNSSPINSWTVYADGRDSSVTDGNRVPTSGNLLDGATGFFRMIWTAEGRYVAAANTGEIGTGWKYNVSVGNFGPDTDMEPEIQIQVGEAVRMIFDLTNLRLADGNSLELNCLNTVSATGARISFYDFSEKTMTLLAGGKGSIPMRDSDSYRVPLNQVVESGDEIIMWREERGAGQYRIRGFEFEVISDPSAVELIAAADPSAIESIADSDLGIVGLVAVSGAGMLLLRRRTKG